MKRFLSLVLALSTVICCFGLTAFADESTATVCVTVANKGTLVAVYEEVTVSDIDNDGALTVNDALYAVHEKVYDGGATAGYGYYVHKDYGLCISKLWGDASGNFGYYLNNASCWSLSDPVKDGDSLYAFVYSDGKFFSDTYSYFENISVEAEAGEEITLKLLGAGYDEEWNPVSLPVANATITVDGRATDITTDENGVAVITLDGGRHIISAVSSDKILVPPVCVAEVEEEEETGIFAALISIFEKIIAAITAFFDMIF